MSRIGTALLGGVLAAVAAGGVASDSAWAAGPGRYAVQGTNPDGSSYTGTASLAQAGNGVWTLNWNVGDTPYNGFGIGDGNVLAFSYTSGGSSGVVMYTAQPDGSYAGVWAPRGARATGTEMLRPR